MEIEIVENKKQSLYVYENDELLFYSKIDFKWTKKNIVKVFDSKSDLMFEVESQKLPFRFQKIKILFQKTKKEKNINALNYNYILFNENQELKRQKDDFFAINQNFSYSLNGIKIAQIKQKTWNSPQKINVEINNQYLD